MSSKERSGRPKKRFHAIDIHNSYYECSYASSPLQRYRGVVAEQVCFLFLCSSNPVVD